MKPFKKIIAKVIAIRVAAMNKDLDGSLTGFWNDEDQVIEIYGHCKKVHPGLADVYPNGWTLGHKETFNQALKKAGLTLKLRPKEPA